MTHELEIMDLEEVHHKGLHYIITRDDKDLNTNIVRLQTRKTYEMMNVIVGETSIKHIALNNIQILPLTIRNSNSVILR